MACKENRLDQGLKDRSGCMNWRRITLRQMVRLRRGSEHHEKKTAKFGEAIVRFSKRIPRNASTNRLIDQLVGCGSSVGANYLEANESFSKKDFRFSISRCVKEAKETKYFLRLIAAGDSSLVEDA